MCQEQGAGTSKPGLQEQISVILFLQPWEKKQIPLFFWPHGHYEISIDFIPGFETDFF